MRPRFLDGATVQENHDRFVRRAAEREAVWTVWNESGPLISQAAPDDEDPAGEPRDVYLFFSDEAYARRALRESWADDPAASRKGDALFDLLFRWLPGLHGDGHLVGTNWTGDLIGLEVEPADLQAQLRAQLPAETRALYQQRLQGARPA